MYSYSALLPLLFATHYFKFATMIRVHHLNNSRSQRVLWLLEEIATPYEIVRYQRDKKTMLAPRELRRVHPLGKSPVIEDGGRTFVETGLIVLSIWCTATGRIWRRRVMQIYTGGSNTGCIMPKARSCRRFCSSS